jgi:putative transposase
MLARHSSCSLADMIFMLIAQLISLALDLCAINHRSERHKDLQILLLRQQLHILQRQHPTSPRVSPWEKFTLAVLAHKLVHLRQGAKGKLDQVVLLFQPATLLKWHRDLVRCQWTFKQQPFIPRHQSDPEAVDLLLRLARENPSWGYSRLHGELLKLGYKIGRSTVRDILKRQQVPPAPTRTKGDSNWGTFLGHYKEQLLACDFFTVETA